MPTYLISRDVFNVLLPERLVVDRRRRVNRIFHQAHARAVWIVRSGVHDGHSSRLELLRVSVDESIEEVGEGVEA